MRKTAFVPVFIFALLPAAFGQRTVPRFDQFPAAVERARAARIDFRRSPGAGTFRTRLADALGRGTNFAGHYIVAGWGCGTGCIFGAVIDARTGRVYFPDQLAALSVWYGGDEYEDEPVKYRKNSHMLVISGVPGSHDDSAPDKPAGDYFYEWKNNDLRLIKFVKRETAQ
jgi:hypothetical protein